MIRAKMFLEPVMAKAYDAGRPPSSEGLPERGLGQPAFLGEIPGQLELPPAADQVVIAAGLKTGLIPAEIALLQRIAQKTRRELEHDHLAGRHQALDLGRAQERARGGRVALDRRGEDLRNEPRRLGVFAR